MTVRDATEDDLARIVEIYNTAIPGRMSTADTTPVAVESRQAWFREHNPGQRPLWVSVDDRTIAGWLSFQSFYGRPAYLATAELSVYVAPTHHRRGIARDLMRRAISRSPDLGLRTLLGFIFGHNEPSLRLFESFGFNRMGVLRGVAELDGVERDLVIVGRRVAAPEEKDPKRSALSHG